MRKTVSEVAQPRSPDEQRFVDLHTIEFWPHPVATDAQFDGTVSKDFSRDADYQPGEDEEVYDTSYEDRNEAVLAELSRDAIDKYMTKADDSERAAKKARNDAEVSGDPFADRRAAAARNTIRKRNRGMNTVMKKLFGEAGSREEAMKEAVNPGDLKHLVAPGGKVTLAWARALEAEKKRIAAENRKKNLGANVAVVKTGARTSVKEDSDLQELSKATLGRYVKRAMNDVRNSNQAIGRRDKGQPLSSNKELGLDAEQSKYHDDNKRIAKVREKGIRTAVGKLTKEAVEVSHDRYLRSHGKKAKGTGGWMFTSKRMGDFDYNDEKQVYSHPGSASFSDAAKGAKAWAKKHGHSAAYVAEHSEVHGFDLQELSKETLASYKDKAHKSSYDNRRDASMYAEKGAHANIIKTPTNNSKSKEYYDKATHHYGIADKRERGIKLAKKKLKNEDAAQSEARGVDLQELSRETLASYKDKATAKAKGLMKTADKAITKSNEYNSRARYAKGAASRATNIRKADSAYYDAAAAQSKANKTAAGIRKASKRLGEETIQELSRNTLHSYVKKAKISKRFHNQLGHEHGDEAVSGNTKYHDDHRDRADFHYGKADRRAAGINKAQKHLGEETLQELSKDTVRSYANKRGQQASFHLKKELEHIKAKDYKAADVSRTKSNAANSKAYAAWDNQKQKERGDGKTKYVRGSAYKGVNTRTESLDETYKAGTVQFKDGSKVTIKAEEASLLNKLLGSLDSHRQAEMMEHVGQSVKNYKAVVEFALATKGK